MNERIITIRSAEDLAALHDTWRMLGPRDVNADPAVLHALLETREDVLRPHVVLAEAGEERALLVARVERTRLPVRLGYITLYAPTVRAVNVVQGGALGADSGTALAAALEEAHAVLRDGQADVLRLRALRVGSPLHHLATERTSRLTRGRTMPASPRWRLFLPDSYDDLLTLWSAKSRGNERRSHRRFEEELAGRFAFHVYRDPADLPRVLRECAAVSEKTYQRALGAGFAPGPSERRLLEVAAENGWLRAYVLTVDGVATAFWIGNAYARVFYAGPTGYDPALAHLRPGSYLRMRMLDELCRDPEADEVDWGLGDAEYKRRFATHGWLEKDVLVFAPTVRGVRMNLTRTTLLTATSAVRRVADRVPALRDVKRRWRTRLGSSAPRRQRWRPAPRIALTASIAAIVPAMLFSALVASAALDRPATTLHDETIVYAPRPVVWKILTDFDAYERWNPYLTDADGAARTGAEIDLRAEPHGETAMKMECEVITVRHLRKLYWRCRDLAMPGLLDREHTFRLLPVSSDGDMVRLVYDGRWEGVLVPFTELAKRKAGYLRMVFALKRRAERIS